MSHRITWRSRPRSGYPWPLRTSRITNLERQGSGVAPNLIGPLSMQAVVELLYRVKEVDVSGGVLMELYSDPFNLTVSGTLTSNLDMDELTKFTSNSHTPGSGRPDGDFFDALLATGGWTLPQQVKPLVSAELRPDLPESEIYIDDDGNYWLHGIFSLEVGDDPAILAFEVTSGDAVTYPSGAPLPPEWVATACEVPLVLKCGTFNLKASIAHVPPNEAFISTDLTLTASKWHPFKTKAGSDAWETDTGAPANGGPGA